MPRKRVAAKPPHSHPELVQPIVEELNRDSPEDRAGCPRIREEEQRVGGALHVAVIWEQWHGVPIEERGAIILDAYKQSGVKEEDRRRITVVLGLTEEEAKRMDIEY